MKARHVLQALLVFGVGLASLAQAGGRWGRVRRGEVNLTEEQKAQFRARREQLLAEGQCGLRLRGRAGLFGALELTEEQKAQLQTLREERRAEMQQHRESGERPTQEEMEQIRAEHRQALEAIFTPEQLQKLEELRAARQEQMGERKGMRPGRWGGRKGRPGALFGALELTEEQKAQFQTLREERRAEMQQRRESGERPTQEEMEQIRAEHRQAFEAILTPEQLEKLEELKANRPRWGRWGAAGEEQEGEIVTTESAVTVPTAVESQSWGNIKKQQAK